MSKIQVNALNTINQLLFYFFCAYIYGKVSIYFSYMGFQYRSFSLLWGLISIFLISGFSFFGKDLNTKIISYILLIPTLAVQTLTQDFDIVLMAIILYLLSYLITIFLFKKTLQPKIFSSNLVVNTLLLILSFLIIFSLYDLIQFSFLLDIYGNREAYKSYISGNNFMPYLKGLAKLVILILTAMSLYKRMYLAAAIFISIIFFLIFSSKYMLLLPVILLLVRIFIFNEKAAFFGIASLFIVYYVSSFIGFDFLYISSIRRAFFLNVLITDSYLGIYENLGPQLFLNDALSFLGSSNISLPYLAGESIYSSASGTIHTNTGSVGFSLAQLGYLGPIIYGIFYGIYFSLMGVKKNINGPNVIILIYISIQSAGISDIFTTMLLHGGALLLLLFRFGELNAKKDTSQATLLNKSTKQPTL